MAPCKQLPPEALGGLRIPGLQPGRQEEGPLNASVPGSGCSRGFQKGTLCIWDPERAFVVTTAWVANRMGSPGGLWADEFLDGSCGGREYGCTACSGKSSRAFHQTDCLEDSWGAKSRACCLMAGLARFLKIVAGPASLKQQAVLYIGHHKSDAIGLAGTLCIPLAVSANGRDTTPARCGHAGEAKPVAKGVV